MARFTNGGLNDMVITENKKLLCVLILFVFVGSMLVISLTRNNVEENLVRQYFTEDHNPQWEIPFSSFNYMEREVFLEWFGSGVRTSEGMAYNPHSMRLIRLFPDSEWQWETTYNPHVIELVRMWEDNGLVGLGILDDLIGQNEDINDVVDRVLNDDLFPSFNARDQQDIRDILTGGFTLLGDGESQMSIERFEDANLHISNILGLDHTDGGIIIERWRRLTRNANSE